MVSEKSPLTEQSHVNFAQALEFQSWETELRRQQRSRRVRRFHSLLACVALLLVFGWYHPSVWESMNNGWNKGPEIVHPTWTDLPNSTYLHSMQSKSIFYLSPSTPRLFISSDLYGSISHRMDESLTDRSRIQVQLIASYSDDEFFKHIDVEKVTRDDEEGIAVKSRSHTDGQIKIVVSYPRTKDLKVKTFETRNHLGSIWIEDLSDVHFQDWKSEVEIGDIHVESLRASSSLKLKSDLGSITSSSLLSAPKISLKSTHGKVAISELSASTATAKSSSGSITGNFSSSELVLDSENGRIDGSFNVSRSLRLKSQNGSIHARVTILDSAKVIAETEHGSIDLIYLDQAKDAKLESNVKSQMGSVMVSHADGFEGDFEVLTEMGAAHVEGPRDDGRVWEVTKDKRGVTTHMIQGWVAKKGRKEGKLGGGRGSSWGKSSLKTEFGSAHLSL